MTTHKAIQLIKYFQRWRKGENIPMPEPSEVTTAIDTLITEFEREQEETKEPVQTSFPDIVIDTAVKVFNTTHVQFLSSNRTKLKCTFPRFAVAKILRDNTKLSFAEIGNKLGHKDHSSALYAVQQAEISLKYSKNDALSLGYNEILSELKRVKAI